MKKRILIQSIFLVCALNGIAQKTEQRPISEFDKLELSGSVNVIFKLSDTLALSVTADEKELDQISTNMNGKTLSITNKGNFKEPFSIYVSGNKLNSILASGAANFKCVHNFKCDSLYINASGAADVKMNVEAKKITMLQSGASEISLKGSSDSFQGIISDAASLKGYSLEVNDMTISTSGAATAKVFVKNKISAVANSASSIKIKGEPKDIIGKSSSAASIKKVESQKASSNGIKKDSLTIRMNKKKLLVIDNENFLIENKNNQKRYFKHWTGVMVGINGYFNNSGGINVPKKYNYMDLNYSRSFNIQVNIEEWQFKIIENHLKIIIGFGNDFHSYAFARKTNLYPDSNFTSGFIDSTKTYTYIKNKLRISSFQVPLLIEFNSSNKANKSFHIAFGVVGQFLPSAYTIQKLERGNEEIKRTVSGNYNVTSFGAKAHINFGYRRWTFYGEYSLTPLFEPGRGPVLYPATVGLRIIPFG